MDRIHLPSDFTGISDVKESSPWFTISEGTQSILVAQIKTLLHVGSCLLNGKKYQQFMGLVDTVLARKSQQFQDFGQQHWVALGYAVNIGAENQRNRQNLKDAKGKRPHFCYNPIHISHTSLLL